MPRPEPDVEPREVSERKGHRGAIVAWCYAHGPLRLEVRVLALGFNRLNENVEVLAQV